MISYREHRRHPNDWTPAQDDMLLSLVGSRKLEALAAQMGRTPLALKQRLWIHGESLRTAAARRAGMSVRDVASAMGVKKIHVWAWIQHGWLKGKRSFGVKRRYTTIDPDDLLFFLRERGALLPNIRPDADWADAVDAARACLLSRLIAGPELARMLVISRGALHYLRTRLDMPDPSLRLDGCLPDYYDRASMRAWLQKHPQYRAMEAL